MFLVAYALCVVNVTAFFVGGLDDCRLPIAMLALCTRTVIRMGISLVGRLDVAAKAVQCV